MEVSPFPSIYVLNKLVEHVLFLREESFCVLFAAALGDIHV